MKIVLKGSLAACLYSNILINRKIPSWCGSSQSTQLAWLQNEYNKNDVQDRAIIYDAI